MSLFGADVQVLDYMTSPVATVHESERLAAARRRMTELGVSALPVVDDTGQLGGVITTSDLLRIGRIRETSRGDELTLPDTRLREHMSSPVEVTSPSSTLAEAASRLVRRSVHRLYVTHNRRAEGVLTTRDLMRAIADARVATPAIELARRSVVAVESGDPISLAADRLMSSEPRALVVMDRGWPVGVFAQREALAAKDAQSGSPIERFFSPAIVCVPPDYPLHRVAARAAAVRPRVVLVTEGPAVLGLLTGLDFARLVAG